MSIYGFIAILSIWFYDISFDEQLKKIKKLWFHIIVSSVTRLANNLRKVMIKMTIIPLFYLFVANLGNTCISSRKKFHLWKK